MTTASPIYAVPVPNRSEGCYLAEVVSVADPEQLGRVQVVSLHADGVTSQNAPIWARVAVPFSGPNSGAFFIPNVGDEVLINFLQGDSRFPIVVGSLWHGSHSPPENLSGDQVNRWSLTGVGGTRIAIEEDQQPTVRFTTPGGVSGELTDRGGGTIELTASGNTITMNTQGVEVQAAAKVTVSAAQVEVNAGQVSVNAAMSKFSGIVSCDVLQATTVIASTYTPGAGNVW